MGAPLVFQELGYKVNYSTNSNIDLMMDMNAKCGRITKVIIVDSVGDMNVCTIHLNSC